MTYIKKIISQLVLLLFGRMAYARWIGVRIGKNCRIYSSVWGSEPFLVTIGDNVTITNGVRFITHDGATWLFRDRKGRRFLFKRIAVGNSVFIGLNSIIMPGVRIDNRVIVAAGSVVTKSVPSGVIVAGVPAEIIGSYDEYEKRALRDYFSSEDMDSTLEYKRRVIKICKYDDFRPYLKNG